MFKINQWNQRVRLEFSIVIVLLFLIIFFWNFPKIGSVAIELPPVPHQQIRMIQIPRTIQRVKQQAPPPVRPSVPVPSDDIEILQEIPLKSSSNISVKGEISTDVPLSEDDLPYIPRQIVEVLPRVDDLKVHGEVTLRLLIDTNGRMKDFKVISNSTGNPICLKRVIEAARKSRWEVIRLNQSKVEYWLTKQYRFGE